MCQDFLEICFRSTNSKLTWNRSGSPSLAAVDLVGKRQPYGSIALRLGGGGVVWQPHPQHDSPIGTYPQLFGVLYT